MILIQLTFLLASAEKPYPLGLAAMFSENRG